MWITRCQVSIAVTSVSTYSCTQKRIEGQHSFMLFVLRLVHMSLHASFDISFRFAAFHSSLLCLNLLPFWFSFSPGLYLSSHWMLVYRDCQASHWKIEPPSKWLEGGHYTHIIIYHNILSIWCFRAEGFWAWSWDCPCLSRLTNLFQVALQNSRV